MYLVDSHCHLDMLSKQDNLSDIINRAKVANVKYLQTICTKLIDLPNIINIINNFDNIFAAVGIHPCELKANSTLANLKFNDFIFTNGYEINYDLTEYDSQIIAEEALCYLTSHPKIIGLGETGLDYYHNDDKAVSEKQIQSFANHIRASCLSSLPMIIHTRAADNDTIDVIKYETSGLDLKGLIHCFTGSKDFARKILNLGLYISFSGIITFKNAQELQDIVKFVPLDRILIETDSPYLAPVPVRGKTNEPAYVEHVCREVAKLKDISFAEVAIASSRNFFHLFTKAKKLIKETI